MIGTELLYFVTSILFEICFVQLWVTSWIIRWKGKAYQRIFVVIFPVNIAGPITDFQVGKLKDSVRHFFEFDLLVPEDGRDRFFSNRACQDCLIAVWSKKG